MLELGDRLVLLDPDEIADRIFGLLVVSVELVGAPHGLLHHRMRESPLDADNHGLVLLVADNHALERSLRHTILLLLRTFGLGPGLQVGLRSGFGGRAALGRTLDRRT